MNEPQTTAVQAVNEPQTTADARTEAKPPPTARLRTKPHVIFAVQNGGPRNRRERRALAPEARRAWEQKLVDSYER